jgi:RNA polymerase sigma-70 factor (ECF subfamily)
MLADRQFVSRLKDRAESAILTLVDSHYAPIFRYLYRLVGDEHIAAELTQETFLKAYTALPRLDDASNLSAWLYQIATNLARQAYRRQRLVRWLSLEQIKTQQCGFEEQVAQHDLVGQSLDQLPADYRSCLLLQIWSGLSCAEIAEVMNKSEDAVKMILSRARRRFHDVYETLSQDDAS